MITINIAKDFSDAPGGRHRVDGPKSGEEFRDEFLEKHFTNNNSEKIQINFDGGFGYATSFLEEAFGGLARKFGVKKVLDKLEFISDEEPSLKAEVIQYIKESVNE